MMKTKLSKINIPLMRNEVVPHENNHSKSIIDFINSRDQFKDPIQRRDYFEHLSEEDFLDFVQQIANLIRTGLAEQQHFDGTTVGLLTHEVPDHREKEDLLRETWKTAKEFLRDSEIPDQDALDYAALTAAGGLLYVHPFADGNGRTSRVLSYIISRGDKADRQELHDILASPNSGRHWQVAPIPMAVEGQQIFDGNQPDHIEWENAFAGEAEDALGGVIANSRYGTAIIRKFIERHGESVKQHLEESFRLNDNSTVTLQGEDFIANLVNDPNGGMTNASELLAIHREVRADYVRRFLKAMRLQQRFEPRRIQPGDLEVNAEDDKFTRGRKTTIAQKLGERAVDGLLTPADQQLIQHLSSSQIRHS